MKAPKYHKSQLLVIRDMLHNEQRNCVGLLSKQIGKYTRQKAQRELAKVARSVMIVNRMLKNGRYLPDGKKG